MQGKQTPLKETENPEEQRMQKLVEELEHIMQLLGQPLTQIEFCSTDPTGHVKH